MTIGDAIPYLIYAWFGGFCFGKLASFLKALYNF